MAYTLDAYVASLYSSPVELVDKEDEEDENEEE